MRRRKRWLKEPWNTIRTPAATIMGIITTAIATMITARIITAMEIDI